MRSGVARVVAAAGVALTLVLTGCGADASAGDTLVVGLYTEPSAIDPNREYYWETYRVSSNIYEPLVKEDLSTDQGVPKPVPALATSWRSSPDGRIWTFDLRQGVKFHDGTDFDAHALDFDIRRFTDPSFEFYDKVSAGMMKDWYADLKQTTVVDDHTFAFEFHRPNLGFPRLLAQSIRSTLVASPAAIRAYGNDGLADHPVGTGPYTFVERKRGDHITLKRNPSYWGPAPKTNRLVFRIIPNNQTRLAALESGDVDLISRVQPTDVPVLEAGGYPVPQGSSAQLDYLSVRYKTAPALQDPRVRRAVAKAVDRAGIARDIYDGYAQPVTSMLNPGNEAYDPALRDHAYDPEGARADLAAAGYRNSLRFNIVADLAGQPEAEYIATNLAAVGITATVVAVDRATYSTRTENPEPGDGLSLDEYGGTYPEWIAEVFNSGVIAKGGKDFVDYQGISGAIDRARYTADPAARSGLWQDADRALLSGAALIPTVNFTRYYALSPRVRGFVWPRTNWYDLTTVSLEPA
ncbi:peptide/nickel transport system substrate-binding protein [Nocardia transvalensis]|uniref:Peptide/nickel transport system substrate-binding protein n=1 Tax=Nocardia transvalensis TaxID=37333 RepID=A0A7W9P9T6_9NOCA|nr:ABC transporter substrate-binding protein [Nocardia transvalensis]MBB5912087.1 peptide/nickel transport system substrate-binding protein [Nocardia transvalensis]